MKSHHSLVECFSFEDLLTAAQKPMHCTYNYIVHIRAQAFLSPAVGGSFMQNVILIYMCVSLSDPPDVLVIASIRGDENGGFALSSG